MWVISLTGILIFFGLYHYWGLIIMGRRLYWEALYHYVINQNIFQHIVILWFTITDMIHIFFSFQKLVLVFHQFFLILFRIIWWNKAYWFTGVFCLDIFASAVFSREISLIGILKKFIKGFGLLLFGETQHIGLLAFVVWIFEPRKSFLESLV